MGEISHGGAHAAPACCGSVRMRPAYHGSPSRSADVLRKCGARVLPRIAIEPCV